MPMASASKTAVSWLTSNVAAPSRNGDPGDSVVALEADTTPRLPSCVLLYLVLPPVLADSVVAEEDSAVVEDSAVEEEVASETVAALETVVASVAATAVSVEEEVVDTEAVVAVSATKAAEGVLKVRLLVLVVGLEVETEEIEVEEEVTAVEDLLTAAATQTATAVIAAEDHDTTTETTEDLLATMAPGQATRTATAILIVARDLTKEAADMTIPASRDVTENAALDYCLVWIFAKKSVRVSGFLDHSRPSALPHCVTLCS